MLVAENIKKAYGSLEVLKGINLVVEKGEIVSIVGASGAGKSTLLHILGTLDRMDTGSLKINDTEVFNLSNKQLANFRNKEIGFIFQFHHLLPEFTAIENVCIPAFIAGKSKTLTEKRAEELLDLAGLKDRMHHKPSALSGGEQQRVAVARALINNPSIILADEPSGNLDSENAKMLHQQFFELRESFNQTFIIVTHNPDLADKTDRKLVIHDGMIE
ncbi:MAG: ABC transporter ATP-binding protein [Chitinophagaceae bacterium]|nr:MAG: ABC transporter ATP-binding protein [Chitinophagaceae bacterium]